MPTCCPLGSGVPVQQALVPAAFSVSGARQHGRVSDEETHEPPRGDHLAPGEGTFWRR